MTMRTFLAACTLSAVITFIPSWLASADEEVIRQDVRLMGADLVDELVYSWLQAPPLGGNRGLVLTEVNAPIGLDDRFTVLVENRLYELLTQNPGLKISLHHCAACTGWVAKSNPSQTRISRGIDQPNVLDELANIAQDLLALSLSFEAEGRDLVLRAQIHEIRGRQKILWAQTYSTSMSSRRLLRDTYPLISLNAAREEQRRILAGRDPLELTTRILIRTFNVAGGTLSQAPLPFIEQTVAAVFPPDRASRAGLSLGLCSLKSSIEAWTFGGEYMRLLFNSTPTLTSPDLYFVLGFHYIRMRGPAAAIFGAKQVDPALLSNLDREPKATLVAYRVGFEAHVKFRIGFTAFLENVPILDENDGFNEETLLFVPYHLFGVGAIFRW